jgi:hypothetical protein
MGRETGVLVKCLGRIIYLVEKKIEIAKFK